MNSSFRTNDDQRAARSFMQEETSDHVKRMQVDFLDSELQHRIPHHSK